MGHIGGQAALPMNVSATAFGRLAECERMTSGTFMQLVFLKQNDYDRHTPKLHIQSVEIPIANGERRLKLPRLRKKTQPYPGCEVLEISSLRVGGALWAHKLSAWILGERRR